MASRTALVASIISVLVAGCIASRDQPSVSPAQAQPGSGASPAEEELAAESETRAPAGQRGLEDRWGIEVVGISLSAAGYMLDFRYRVIDPEKAAPLFDRTVKPYLIDEATGSRALVPAPPKVGPLRQTTLDPAAGRIYFVMFANPGKSIESGRRVTVVIGDFRAEHLTVE